MFDLTKRPFENLSILQINRLPERTCYYPEGRVVCLSGMWAFRWFASALAATQAIVKEPGDLAHGYQPIAVPRSWQFAGFGRFHYTDEAFPFPLDPPFVPGQNETGVYKRSFEAAPNGMRTVLRLEGVESCATVYINGNFAGYTQGSRLPSEFDITEQCHRGENILCIVVHQYCDGTYLEDQDMWWLGGIIRDVFVLYRPVQALENVVLDADYQDGVGFLRIRTQSAQPVHIELTDKNGAVCLEVSDVGSDQRFILPSVEPWSAEIPTLYTLTVSTAEETARFAIGFRRIAIVDGELQLNGKRLMLRGVNRHEFSPENGRAVTYEDTRRDLLLMKKYHINAVRTSHYPNAPFFYDLCDALGLYVIDECDLETHGFEIEGQPRRLVEDPLWRDAYLDRAIRTVSRDRNHACIVMWSLGNESYWGTNLIAMYDWIHAADPTRPIHYECDRTGTHADVTGTMYSTVGGLYELDVAGPKKPHILCEFVHAMGNGPGGIKEYVEVMESSRRIQGYFVWEWRDHGIKSIREDGTTFYRYGGEFEEDYHSGHFCMDALIASDGTPTPGFFAYTKAIEPLHPIAFHKDRMECISRFAFRTVSCHVHFTLRKDGQILTETTHALPPVAPCARFSVPLPQWETPDNALYTLEMLFVQGEERFGTGSTILRSYVPVACIPTGGVQIEEQEDRIVLSSDAFSVAVDLSCGELLDYQTGGRPLLTAGPRLDLFRATIDNDARVIQHEWDKWHLHSLSITVLTAQSEHTASGARVTLTARLGANAKHFHVPHTIVYDFYADGTIRCAFSGCFEGDYGANYRQEVPRIGVNMRLPSKLQQVQYEAFGPDETYCDSVQQARYDVYRTTVSALSFPYEYPQDSGNRTGFRWVALTDASTYGLAIASDTCRDMSAHTCSTHDLWKATHAADVPQRDFVEVHIDYRTAGLGSGSCGPSHLAAYSVQTIPFAFRFVLTPVDADALFAARHALNLLEEKPC